MNPAFAYLYDEFLNEKQYEREINAIEAELASRNIDGRVARLAMFRNTKELVEDVIHHGAKNVVVVGNDVSLGRFMWHAPGLDAAVGYLPVGKPSHIAEVLSIPRGPVAVEILAARFLEQFDIGCVNDDRFLIEIIVKDPDAELVVDGQFSIKPIDGGLIIVRNLGAQKQMGEPESNAKDGKLEAIIRPRAVEERSSRRKKQGISPKEQTILTFKEAAIYAPHEIEIEVDGNMRRGDQFHISVDTKKLDLITGRRRRQT